MEPQRLIGQPVDTDDHRGRYVGRLEELAPRRDQLAVAGEHDCLGRSRRDIRRDLPSTVVLERLGDELSRDCADDRSVIHGRTLPSEARNASQPVFCRTFVIQRGSVGGYPASYRSRWRDRSRQGGRAQHQRRVPDTLCAAALHQPEPGVPPYRRHIAVPATQRRSQYWHNQGHAVLRTASRSGPSQNAVRNRRWSTWELSRMTPASG